MTLEIIHWTDGKNMSENPVFTSLTLQSLQAELTSINDIYTSYKPIIIPAINLLDTDPSFDRNSNYNKYVRRSMLPFLGNTLSWLTGTATTKDVNGMKKRVNQLTAAKSTQEEAIVHTVSILNVTQYAAQVNRQQINIVMDTVGKMVHDVNNLYNITTSLSSTLSYYQLVLHLRSVSANLSDYCPISEQSPCIPCIMSMQPLQDHFHPTSYPLQILSRCYHTLRRQYLQPCIYQCHLRTPYTFIDAFALMF